MRIAPYNHKGNGRVETVHGIVKDMLRAFIDQFERDWDLLIPYLEFAYNTQKNTVTKYSPYFLQFGRRPNCPIDVKYHLVIPNLLTTDEYAQLIETRMYEVFNLVTEIRREKAQDAAAQYNATHQTKVFKKGDSVLLLDQQIRKGINKKLQRKTHTDVFKILDVCSPQTYNIQNTKTTYVIKGVNRAQLRPYSMRVRSPSKEGGGHHLEEDSQMEWSTTPLDTPLNPGSRRRSTKRSIMEYQFKDDKFQVWEQRFQGRPGYKWISQKDLESSPEGKELLEKFFESEKIKGQTTIKSPSEVKSSIARDLDMRETVDVEMEDTLEEEMQCTPPGLPVTGPLCTRPPWMKKTTHWENYYYNEEFENWHGTRLWLKGEDVNNGNYRPSKLLAQLLAKSQTFG